MDEQVERTRSDATGKRPDGDAPSAEPQAMQRQRPYYPPAVPSPQIAEVPRRLVNAYRIVSLGTDAAAHAFQILRTQVLLRMLQDGLRTVAITSPNRRTGTSTVAANLAISLSMEFDSSTVLVDANLRYPSIRRMLDLPPGAGLPEHLAGMVPLDELVVSPGFGRLQVVPGGTPLTHAAEILRSPMMVNLIQDLRERHTDRFIVFDAPAVLDGADMLAFAPQVDAVVLVAEEGKTTTQDLQRSCQLLEQTNVLGVVLNRSEEVRISHRSLFRHSSRGRGDTVRGGQHVTLEQLTIAPGVEHPAPQGRLFARRRLAAVLVVALLGVGLVLLGGTIADEPLRTALSLRWLVGADGG